MLKFNLGDRKRNCAGVSRRTALRLGACGLIGGLTLPRIMELQAQAAGGKVKAKSCIFLFLEGGPPHQDMWDPKPEAPPEIRGPFSAISTNVPGTFVTDQLPLCSKMADKYTIVRSHSHRDNGHSTGYHYVMTGRRANFADGDTPVPNNPFYPSIGSVASRELGPRGALPAYINLPHPMAGGGPGFYGPEHAPFVIEADPTQPDFEVKDLQPAGRLSAERLTTRQRLLAGIDQLERSRNSGQAQVMSKYYEKAYNLIASPEAKKAFDLHAESDKTRDAYGRNQLGQCALLARRLVEGGCRFVGVDAPGWDVHFNCFPSLKNDLIPYADRAFSALVTDLEQRGLLDETLVIMMGEMGRTPRINARAGRDHWSMAQTIVFAGGGIIPGQVIGATDSQAAAPTTEPVTVSDFLRTVSVLMGINPDRQYQGPLGRPIAIVDGGKEIKGLA
ncbi:DUF1501 domain-containing protein [Lignipirellula cremea]|uniref:DUF1501 domain-containing protein n=1 Tax=Lignipirellula cremea TaxID=2528010 RepID=A0A518E2U0_9BACT|nr:DUF1501 domain-containing protein [Lignipirellula cremea]QDU98383.1 hypothetical protein Pla8534_62510 [Lignipirellula cremea]